MSSALLEDDSLEAVHSVVELPTVALVADWSIGPFAWSLIVVAVGKTADVVALAAVAVRIVSTVTTAADYLVEALDVVARSTVGFAASADELARDLDGRAETSIGFVVEMVGFAVVALLAVLSEVALDELSAALYRRIHPSEMTDKRNWKIRLCFFCGQLPTA
jgi:hypothetical protein